MMAVWIAVIWRVKCTTKGMTVLGRRDRIFTRQLKERTIFNQQALKVSGNLKIYKGTPQLS